MSTSRDNGNTDSQHDVDKKYSPNITSDDKKHFGDAKKWLKKTKSYNNRVYGNNVPLFTKWKNRRECALSGCHTNFQAGIGGYNKNPAASIVASSGGGYDDDKELVEDYGNVLIYTGQGGSETEDQKMTNYNRSLLESMKRKWPVRVVRGYQYKSPYAPKEGYRYDGLYWVTNYWMHQKPEGNKVFKFRLVRLKGQAPVPKQKNYKPKPSVTRAEYLRAVQSQIESKRRSQGLVEKKSKKRRKQQPEIEEDEPIKKRLRRRSEDVSEEEEIQSNEKNFIVSKLQTQKIRRDDPHEHIYKQLPISNTMIKESIYESNSRDNFRIFDPINVKIPLTDESFDFIGNAQLRRKGMTGNQLLGELDGTIQKLFSTFTDEEKKIIQQRCIVNQIRIQQALGFFDEEPNSIQNNKKDFIWYTENILK